MSNIPYFPKTPSTTKERIAELALKEIRDLTLFNLPAAAREKINDGSGIWPHEMQKLMRKIADNALERMKDA